jgi:CubicO group peptidase (beta-lactamase class C family)
MTTDQTGSYRSTAEGYPIFKWGAGFVLQAGEGVIGIGSPQSYGHFGGTGCAGWIDPEAGVAVAFVSNSHVMRGRGEWIERLEEAVNVAIAVGSASG